MEPLRPVESTIHEPHVPGSRGLHQRPSCVPPPPCHPWRAEGGPGWRWLRAVGLPPASLPDKSPRSRNCPALAQCPRLTVSGNTAGAPLGTRAISRSCSSLRQGHEPSVWPGSFLGLASWPPRAWSRARSGCGHEEQEMEPTHAPACVPCIRICSSR